jgi:hypothetical protein
MKDFPDEVGRLRCPACGATRDFVLEGWDRVVFEWRPFAGTAGAVDLIEYDERPAVEDRCLVWCGCGHEGEIGEFEVEEG